MKTVEWSSSLAPARPGARLLYLHGGAYVLGSANAYRHLAGQIAARAKAAVFIAEYRLAPEHRFPAALEDAKAAYRRLVESGARRSTIPAATPRRRAWPEWRPVPEHESPMSTGDRPDRTVR